MKRQLACLMLAVAAAALSGCYYDPGYSYVRGSGYGGDAYYGSGSTYYAAPGYYGGYYPYYYPSYYGGYYAPGVSVGISGRWYGGSRYRDYRHYRDFHDRGYHGRGYYRGDRRDWSGHRGRFPPNRHQHPHR